MKLRMHVLALILVSTSALGQIQEGDAVCQGDPIPPGFVPTSSIVSAGCSGEGKAWVLSALADKVVACEAPNYLKDPAPNIGYIACDKVMSASCPPTVDGTSNGFVLRPIGKCVHDAEEDDTCPADMSYPVKVAGKCTNTYWCCGCPKGDPAFFSFNEWWTVYHRAPHDGMACTTRRDVAQWPFQFLPVCTSDNAFYWAQKDLDFLTSSENRSKYPWAPALLAKRLFYDSACDGPVGVINAMVIGRYGNDELSVSAQTQCELGLALGTAEPINGIEYFHDDSCGVDGYGPKRLNARSIKFQ